MEASNAVDYLAVLEDTHAGYTVLYNHNIRSMGCVEKIFPQKKFRCSRTKF
jgi:hypothetical protein